MMVVLVGFSSGRLIAATNVYDFSYTNRAALLADGWDFLGRTSSGVVRNTEITNGGSGAVISYDQSIHPGAIRIPLDSGDLWAGANNSHNSLFRSLPTNWIRFELDFIFAPTNQFQQLNLALYQDDNNYFQTARTFHPAVTLVRETNGVPSVLASPSVVGTNVSLRLERDITFGDISVFYCVNGSNWVFVGKTGQELINPRLCIWVGGSTGGSVSAELRQARIVTSDTPIISTLSLQPLDMVFSCVEGQSNTNVQRVNIYHRGPDGFLWTASKDATWLSVASTNGITPGTCDVSVNTAGLTNGIYQTALTFTAMGAVTNTTLLPVTLIVNPVTRASVSTWKDGKNSAMSIWVDDSGSVMFNELNAAGFKGSYALMGPGTQSPLFTTYHNSGMELGAHTETHPCNPLSGAERQAQFANNISNILASTPQTTARLISFAWPCGANTTREKVWSSDYFLISRGYNINQLEDTTPKDFMEVKSYNSHEHPPFPPTDLKTVVDAAIAQGKWANLVFHGFNNDDGAVAYAVGKDIWVGTAGDVIRYITQRDRTVFTNYFQTAGHIRFDCRRLALPASVSRSFETAFSTNDTVTFKVAVTNLPPIAGVQVNGYPVPFTVRTAASETNLFFDSLISSTSKTVLITLSNGPVLTASPSNYSRVYLQTNPTLAGSLTGVTGGDNITATYVTAANVNSSAGVYPITPIFSDPGNLMGNYTVITNLGALNVTKSNASVTLSGLNQSYNGAAQSVTVSTTPSGLAVSLTYNGSSNSPTNAGTYQVIGTIDDVNHQGTKTNSFVITTIPLSATANNSNRMVGRSNPAFTGNIVGVMPADGISATYNSPANTSSPVGYYAIVPTFVDPNSRLSNYAVTTTNGLLAVVGSPQFSSITRTPSGEVQLTCNTYTGRVYDFQHKSTLADTDWMTFVSNHLATGSVAVITNTTTTNLQRYYRAVDVSFP